MKRDRILVTGGAGFIGSHTVELLLAQGKQVTILDNLASGKLENLNLQHPDVTFVEGDILEFPLVEQLLRDVDAVLHLAAIPSVPRSVELPILTSQVNMQGTLHILQAIKEAKRDIRFVFASSSATYGDNDKLPCVESDANLAPLLSPYALQKWQSEEYTRLYTRLFDSNCLALRYFNVYGPRQDPSSPYSGVISLFINAYAEDKEFIIYGDGQQSRDFIQVKDIAAANALALESDYKGALNIATGKAQTLLDLVACLEQAGQRKAKYRFESARAGDILHSYGSPAQAQQHLGFKASIPLSVGIKEMLRGEPYDKK